MDKIRLYDDNDAVSSVISIVLMVAVALILATVLSVFALGFGESVSSTAPTATFTAETGEVTLTDNQNDVRTLTVVNVTHTQGDEIDQSKIDIKVDGVPAYSVINLEQTTQEPPYREPFEKASGPDQVISPGDTTTVLAKTAYIDKYDAAFTGDDIRVAFQSDYIMYDENDADGDGAGIITTPGQELEEESTLRVIWDGGKSENTLYKYTI